MDGWIASASPGRCYLRASAVLLASAASAMAMTAIVQAQTLTNPNPKAHASATSSQQSKRMKPCAAFGPGFVQIPGSDLCIKIGGFVQSDVTVFGR